MPRFLARALVAVTALSFTLIGVGAADAAPTPVPATTPAVDHNPNLGADPNSWAWR
jgi:hypothetical protein